MDARSGRPHRRAAVPALLLLLGGPTSARVWVERLKGKVRTDVRETERAGLIVESGSSGRFVRDFYDLYLGWIGRRATERGLPKPLISHRAESLRKYQEVAEELGTACRIWIARLDDKTIAAIITLIPGGYVSYWRGYSNKDLSGRVSANHLLHRIAIEYACNSGFLCYNMGWSGTASLAGFKRSFGALSRQFSVYIFDRIKLARMEGLRSGLGRGEEMVVRDG